MEGKVGPVELITWSDVPGPLCTELLDHWLLSCLTKLWFSRNVPLLQIIYLMPRYTRMSLHKITRLSPPLLQKTINSWSGNGPATRLAHYTVTMLRTFRQGGVACHSQLGDLDLLTQQLSIRIRPVLIVIELLELLLKPLGYCNHTASGLCGCWLTLGWLIDITITSSKTILNGVPPQLLWPVAEVETYESTFFHKVGEECPQVRGVELPRNVAHQQERRIARQVHAGSTSMYTVLMKGVPQNTWRFFRGRQVLWASAAACSQHSVRMIW